MCFFKTKRNNNNSPPPYDFKNNEKQINKKQIRYHGPITNSTNNTNNNIKIVRVTNNQNQYSMIYYLDQAQLPKNISINGLDPVPIIIKKDEINSYFREQQRLLKNRYHENLLRLEAQKVYSNIIRHC